MVSSTAKAGGLQHAEAAGIPTARRSAASDFPSGAAGDKRYGDAIFAACRDAGVDYVAMAGFLKLAPVPDDFAGRVVNIHPALIPSFCGPGMYGHHVHQAVLDAGVKVTGCTVHFVDNQYDHGPIIWQQPVPVFADDTADTLAARVFEAEKEAYPHVLKLLAAGRVQLDGGRVTIRKPQRGERSHRRVPDRLIERDRRGPTGVRLELDFAESGVPRRPLQAGHQRAAHAAASPPGIDQQPMDDGDTCCCACSDRQCHGANEFRRRVAVKGQQISLRLEPGLVEHLGLVIGVQPRTRPGRQVGDRPFAQRQPRRHILRHGHRPHAKLGPREGG